MPNHVTNVVYCADHRVISELLSFNPDGTELVDFAKIIPLPDNYERGGCSGKHDPGIVCWYQWNIVNWGTKWNAYNTLVFDEHVSFETAWSHPFPVIRALSQLFPEVKITVKYADEDLSYNCGEYIIQDGEIQSETDMLPGSKEAQDFAAQLLYGMTYEEFVGGLDGDFV